MGLRLARWWRRGGGGGGGRGVAGAAALALALAALAALARAPSSLESRAEYPRAHAAAVAHLLADYSTHPHADRGAWRVEEERGNYTEWSYRVTFECGARCAGEARVSLTERGGGGGVLEHGRARAHTVRVRLAACQRLPLLPWPRLCEEMEITSAVYSTDAGCAVEERAVAWCGAARAAAGACAADLRAHRAAHRARLRAALAAGPGTGPGTGPGARARARARRD